MSAPESQGLKVAVWGRCKRAEDRQLGSGVRRGTLAATLISLATASFWLAVCDTKRCIVHKVGGKH